MQIVKRVVTYSMVMVLVPTIVFAILYVVLAEAARSDTADIQADVQGNWTGVQYYIGSEKFVCSQGHSVSVAFAEDQITIISADIPAGDHLPCTWGKRSLTFTVDGTETTASLYFDTGGYLHMVISEWEFDLALVRDAAVD